MSDLTIHATHTCASNVEWSTTVKGSTGKEHTVAYKRLPAIGDTLYGHTCSCKGFKYHHTCRHVKAVLASGERCGWNWELEVTSEAEWCGDEPCCPVCGGDVETVMVGV